MSNQPAPKTHTMAMTIIDSSEWPGMSGTAKDALKERVDRLKASGTPFTLEGNKLTYTEHRKDRQVILTYTD